MKPAFSQIFQFTVILFIGVFLLSCGSGEDSENAAVDPNAVVEEPMDPEEQALNEMLKDPEIFQSAPDEPVPLAEPFVLNKAAQCSILCYHDFSERKSDVDAMCIHVSDFEKQMEALANAQIPVIPMSDFLLWRKGQKNIPDPCVVITIDDGWVAVYDHAFPILKKYGYPFTMYLYKNYVGTGGRSLSKAEIMELKDAGAEIGSHSVSHAFMSRKSGKSQSAYEAWLKAEIEESGRFLQETFGEFPKTFAYPYGDFNDDIAQKTLAAGYEAAFTVNGRKCSWEDDPGKIGRFIIEGKPNGNFRIATSFRGRGNAGDNQLLSPTANPEEQLVSVYPRPEQRISERRPVIAVDVTRLGRIVPGSVSMTVAGFGEVIPDYNEEEGVIRYQIPVRLRNESCFVQVKLQREGEDKPLIIPWKFSIDPQSLYLNPPEEKSAPVEAAQPTPAGTTP